MYIKKLTKEQLISFLKFFDCDKEHAARVSIVENNSMEYEPNQEILKLMTTIKERKFTMLYTDHGLVNIYKNCDPSEPMVSVDSEYGCFEQAASSIMFTKRLIGFMASIFKLDYLKNEYIRRDMILEEINAAIEKTDQDKMIIEMEMNHLGKIMEPMSKEPSKFQDYFREDLKYMRLQQDITAADSHLQELYNHKNYHSKIQEYISELGIELFGASLKTGTTTKSMLDSLNAAKQPQAKTHFSTLARINICWSFFVSHFFMFFINNSLKFLRH